MGLLSKASSQGVEAPVSLVAEGQKKDFALDEMGEALRERLGRLPQNKSTPNTALTLLKAYGAFHTGLCLSLGDGNYSGYASVGLGLEKLSIPAGAIWSGENAQAKFFKIDSPESLGITNSEQNFIYWVFPLDSSVHNTKEPWGAVMILGASESSGFNPEPISIILDDVADKMVFPASEEDAASVAPEVSFTLAFDSGQQNTVENEVTLFHRLYLDFNCIVLENPAAESGFCEKVSAIINKAGTVIPLASDRPMILFPIALDRELIAHRLSKTLNTKPLLSFEANNPENVFTRINSLF